MRKIVSIIILLFLFADVRAELLQYSWEKAEKVEAKTVYEKACYWFIKNTQYELNVHYASFTDHVTANAYERSHGSYKRSGDQFYSNALGMITIQNNKMRTLIDTVNEMIVITDKSIIKSNPVSGESTLTLFDAAVSVKKQSKENSTTYRLEFKPNKLYDAFEYEIDNKGLILRISYFYSKEVKKENAGADAPSTKPRTEITFSNYKNVSGNQESSFSTARYYKVEGKNITATAKYKNYELKDYRSDKK